LLVILTVLPEAIAVTGEEERLNWAAKAEASEEVVSLAV